MTESSLRNSTPLNLCVVSSNDTRTWPADRNNAAVSIRGSYRAEKSSIKPSSLVDSSSERVLLVASSPAQGPCLSLSMSFPARQSLLNVTGVSK